METIPNDELVIRLLGVVDEQNKTVKNVLEHINKLMGHIQMLVGVIERSREEYGKHFQLLKDRGLI